MGLPQILIEFARRADTAIKRSSNGIVALVLIDNTKEPGAQSYKNEDEVVKSHYTVANLDYISKAFLGNPRLVIVERIKTEDELETALTRLKNKKWNYLSIPGLSEENAQTVADWIKVQRAENKTYKAVLANCAANHEGIINFTTDGIAVGTKKYTTAEYCVRIAGLLAGLSLTQSSTYYVLSEVTEITESITPDNDIDSGKLILINDGEKVKIGRGVNSLTTLSDGKTEDMKKIKIMEGIDLIRDDIRETFENQYVGLGNSYENKLLFVVAVNQYYKLLEKQEVLYDKANNTAEIDVESQKEYLMQNTDITDWSDQEIKEANTGSYIFVMSDIRVLDSIEDCKFKIYM